MRFGGLDLHKSNFHFPVEQHCLQMSVSGIKGTLILDIILESTENKGTFQLSLHPNGVRGRKLMLASVTYCIWLLNRMVTIFASFLLVEGFFRIKFSKVLQPFLHQDEKKE